MHSVARAGAHCPQHARRLFSLQADACVRMIELPRYLVERRFPDGLQTPSNDNDGPIPDAVIKLRANGVSWVQSFPSPNDRQCLCIYDAPSPDAIRAAAQSAELASKITAIRVLDPYFYD